MEGKYRLVGNGVPYFPHKQLDICDLLFPYPYKGWETEGLGVESRGPGN